jgi:hypothetical protein
VRADTAPVYLYRPAGTVILHHRLNHCPSANYSAAICPAVFYEYVRTAADDGPSPEQMFRDWSAEVRACAALAAATEVRTALGPPAPPRTAARATRPFKQRLSNVLEFLFEI